MFGYPKKIKGRYRIAGMCCRRTEECLEMMKVFFRCDTKGESQVQVQEQERLKKEIGLRAGQMIQWIGFDVDCSRRKFFFYLPFMLVSHHG